jgi:hypothetical protein
VRRPAAVWCVAALVLCAACGNSNLTKRELVVVFAPTATPAQHAEVLTACAGATPKASPEPLPSAFTHASDSVGDVRFRIDHASDRDLNTLLQCLRRQPGVVGFQTPEAGG